MAAFSIRPLRFIALRFIALRMLAALLCLTAAVAHADVYGYIDPDGTGHFSTIKIDARYRLFVKGDQAFDSKALTASNRSPSVQSSSVQSSSVQSSSVQSSLFQSPVLQSPLFQYLLQHPNLKKYDALLLQAAADYDVEPALLKAIMAAESGFNPTAVSNKGAIGLMQLLPATAERYGLSADRTRSLHEKLTDPKTNIRLGARYLRDLRQLFPDQPDLVIASYNAGEGAVQKYRNTIPPFPETRHYVQLVSQFYQIYRPHESIGNTRRVQMILPGRRDTAMTSPSESSSNPD